MRLRTFSAPQGTLQGEAEASASLPAFMSGPQPILSSVPSGPVWVFGVSVTSVECWSLHGE